MKANSRRNQTPELGTAMVELTSRRLGWSSSSCLANRHEERGAVASASDMERLSETSGDVRKLCHGSTLCNRLYFIVGAFWPALGTACERGQSETPVAPAGECR